MSGEKECKPHSQVTVIIASVAGTVSPVLSALDVLACLLTAHNSLLGRCTKPITAAVNEQTTQLRLTEWRSLSPRKPSFNVPSLRMSLSSHLLQ